MSTSVPPGVGVSAPHDHDACLARSLGAAERLCAERRLRLTPQRRRVLEVVAARHAGIGAYEIIDALATRGPRPAPISVYRALDFLVAQGLIHRVDSLSAFVLCASPGDAAHRAQFLICKSCREIAELRSDAVDAAIAKGAATVGFSVSAAVVEVSGVCRACSGL